MLQDEIGDIEQGLARSAIAHPGPGEIAEPVIQRKARAQQRNLQALCALYGVRTSDQQLRKLALRGLFQILQIADVDLSDGQTLQHLGADRRGGGNDFGPAAREQRTHASE